MYKEPLGSVRGGYWLKKAVGKALLHTSHLPPFTSPSLLCTQYPRRKLPPFSEHCLHSHPLYTLPNLCFIDSSTLQLAFIISIHMSIFNVHLPDFSLRPCHLFLSSIKSSPPVTFVHLPAPYTVYLIHNVRIHSFLLSLLCTLSTRFVHILIHFRAQVNIVVTPRCARNKEVCMFFLRNIGSLKADVEWTRFLLISAERRK